jgi:N-methylhydantoinase A/acetone carboxylase beta subunit
MRDNTDATGTTDPVILAMDTGGTMTDTFVMDEDGRYTVGKAQSTPEREAEGIVRSIEDALGYWGLPLEDGVSTLNNIVYTGTAMLNRLLERSGDENIGVVTNRGFEDILRFGRGIQSWINLSYSGRLHGREHEHPEPIVPRENVKGVRGRINSAGNERIPLYEEEARAAVQDLIDEDVRIICVCLLHSYLNDAHEERVKEIADDIQVDRGSEVSVWLSSDQNPIRGELPRLNTLVLEAYAVEPSRKQLYGIQEELQSRGSNAPLRALSASGGTVSPDHDWLIETMVSGPIGGVFGGEYLVDQLGISNLVCSDVGGTSFDVSLITDGHYPTRWDQSLAQFMVSIPFAAMDTIGSGTGSYVRIDQTSGRLEVGPDSAGYLIGVSNPDSGLETPTVTDCTAMLGYLNPDYFLGGDIELDVDRAEAVIEDEIASELNTDPYETARGVLDIVERNMTNELRAMIHGLGYSPENYHLVSYGGGGPLHAAGYSAPLDFVDVLIPDWAAGFSAFGSSCTDYGYRYDTTVEFEIRPDLDDADRVADELSATIDGLRAKAVSAFERDGIAPASMVFKPEVRMQYAGMLDQLTVQIPPKRAADGLDAETITYLVDQFEAKFDTIFKRAARSPEQGYAITMAIGTGVVPAPKPTLPSEEPVDGPPIEAASKGSRMIYWEDDWHDAQVWEMDRLQAGNTIVGPAIVEAPATTMLVPPGYEAPFDEHRIFHLHKEGST